MATLRQQLEALETRCSRLQDHNAELQKAFEREVNIRRDAESKLKDAEQRVDGCQSALNTMRQALSKYEGKFELMRELGMLPKADEQTIVGPDMSYDVVNRAFEQRRPWERS